MELGKFSGRTLKQFVEANKIADAEAYIRKYFYRCETDIFFFNGKAFKRYSMKDAIQLIPKDIVSYYRREVIFKARDYLGSSDFMEDEYVPTIDQTKPKVFVEGDTKYINMAKRRAITETIEVTEPLKADLKRVYDHIFNIWCSKNEEQYEWVLNFIACTFAGRKLRKAIYSSCNEGSGRGSIINFLATILGDAMVKTESVETVTKYTKPFEGTLLVNLDEMPVDGSNFKSIADSCKSLITEPTFTCRDMYSVGYEQKNTFNMIITSNNDAIHLTQKNKRRYMVLDIDESRIGDTVYFTSFNRLLARDDIKKGFYSDMMRRYETLGEWNEDNLPQSKERKIKIMEALPKLYKFIKDEFILKKTDLDMKTSDFIQWYTTKTKDNMSNIKIGKLLKQLKVTPIKINKNNNKTQYYVYRATHQQLMMTFEANGWIDDDYDHVDIDTVGDTEDESNALRKENEELRKEIARLKSLLDMPTMEKIPEKKSKSKEFNTRLDTEIVEKAPKKKTKKTMSFDDSIKHIFGK